MSSVPGVSGNQAETLVVAPNDRAGWCRWAWAFAEGNPVTALAESLRTLFRNPHNAATAGATSRA